MINSGDVVIVDFPGVTGLKRRPVVIISSPLYHTTRPDIIVGLVTSQVQSAIGPTDWLLRDWQSTGLRQPSAFRSFLHTSPRTEIIARIGHLSVADWKGIQTIVGNALDLL